MKTKLDLPHGVQVNLDIRDDRYHGLRDASLNGQTMLVQGRGSCLPYIQTPDGIAYTQYRPLQLVESESKYILELEALGQAAPLKSDVDLFGFPRLSQTTGSFSDRISICFEPAIEEVDGELYYGFGVSYSWSSESRAIHWLYESVAIAPLGSVAGGRLMAQNMTQNLCPLEMVIDQSAIFSSQEHYDRSCIESPGRGGGSQIFDLVQRDALAVVSLFREPSAHGNGLKSNCQTMQGEDFVTVSDFHYGKLQERFETAQRIVVAAPRQDDGREDAVNRWTAWYDYTANLWCDKLGMKRSRVTPTLTFEGTGIGGVDIGMSYPELLTVWEERLDWVAKQGFKAINLHTPEWISAANRRTLVFGGNNCCPWEFKVSEQMGGEAGLRRFCDACHARGIKVFVWIAGHLHREAPVWKEHPEWAVKRADDGLWDGHYGVLHSMSFVEGACDWLYQDLKHLRETTGVDGVWFDSFTNLALGAINWQRPDRAPNGPAVMDFLADLSRLGYEIMIECMSQLGVSSWGNLKPAELAGKEELLLNSNMRYFLRMWLDDPAITRELYFKSLAARAPLGVWLEEFIGHPEEFPLALPDWFAPLTRAFNEVESVMHFRRLLPEGVLWLDASNDPSAFFSYVDGEPPGDAMSGLMDALTKEPASAVRKGHIYRIAGSDA